MNSLFEQRNKPPAVLAGDPVLQVGDHYIIAPGYGDFRISRSFAQEMIIASELAKAGVNPAGKNDEQGSVFFSQV